MSEGERRSILEANYNAVRARVDKACERAGR